MKKLPLASLFDLVPAEPPRINGLQGNPYRWHLDGSVVRCTVHIDKRQRRRLVRTPVSLYRR
jgi:hypothetical protein